MESAVTRSADGVRYRDLNKNGQLDHYEDPRLPIAARVEDLLARLTLEEKAGLLFHTMVSPPGAAGPLRGMPATEDLIADRYMNHFNLAGGGAARELAAWHNALVAVRAQLPDVPHDSVNPLFPFGFGLTY